MLDKKRKVYDLFGMAEMTAQEIAGAFIIAAISLFAIVLFIWLAGALLYAYEIIP